MPTMNLIVASFMCLFAASNLCGTERRPNFVIFFTDDQGYNDVGCFGSELIRTESARWIASGKPTPADGGGPYPYRFRYSDAIGHEPGVSRRDPSDVIEVKGTYYVWYTKVLKSQRGYPSGYPGSVWYATSPDGKRWAERGPAVEPGLGHAWDGHGVFTPNILVAGGKYYLYYTAVPEPFDVPWTAGKTPTAIGVAIADSPDGPWKKFDGNPILERSDRAEDFDSFRVDDAALVVRGGRIWLYYKGRSLVHGQAGPGKTRMGVAISASPVGPFAKQDANPLHAGHEVMVWPHGKGVASMATAAGPRRIYFAADGLHFRSRNVLAGAPSAPGAFRSDHFAGDAVGQSLQWGICHGRKDGDLYLRRFDCEFTSASVPAARQGRSQCPTTTPSRLAICDSTSRRALWKDGRLWRASLIWSSATGLRCPNGRTYRSTSKAGSTCRPWPHAAAQVRTME